MINRLAQTAYCPKCGGRVFLDQDYYGWYAQCLLCGHLQNLEKIVVPVKVIGVVSNQPGVIKRIKMKR